MSSQLFFELSVAIGSMQCADGIVLLVDRGRVSATACCVSCIELAWLFVCVLALVAWWIEGPWRAVALAYVAYYVGTWIFALWFWRSGRPRDPRELRLPRGAAWAGLVFGVAYAAVSLYAAWTIR